MPLAAEGCPRVTVADGLDQGRELARPRPHISFQRREPAPLQQRSEEFPGSNRGELDVIPYEQQRRFSEGVAPNQKISMFRSKHAGFVHNEDILLWEIAAPRD